MYICGLSLLVLILAPSRIISKPNRSNSPEIRLHEKNILHEPSSFLKRVRLANRFPESLVDYKKDRLRQFALVIHVYSTYFEVPCELLSGKKNSQLP